MSISVIPSSSLIIEPPASSSSHSFLSLRFDSKNLTNFPAISSSCGLFTACRRSPIRRRKQRMCKIRAVSLPDPVASSSSNSNSGYHPSEELKELVSEDDARLTDAETARTLVEVNSKATLMFSGLTDDDIPENIIWPDLPYLTDEHGDMYFEVRNHEDVLKTLIGDDKIVQVIVGLDNVEMLEEMDISGTADFDYGMEEITGEDSDIDDDSDEDAFTILEDEEDDLVLSESSNDWTNLETMQSSHPMYFARKISEVVSNVSLDWMDHPSASIIVQGVLRPAFLEEHSIIKKNLPVNGTSMDDVHHLGKDVEENIKEELDKDQSSQGGTVFYKLEMIRIHLVSTYGTQSSVEVQDFRKARPDVVAHHSAKIISQLESTSDKTIPALKSLCWRLKNIKVEEAAITGVDSLGFDLRVCSGTQVQTLRFAFIKRATSELIAERQLHDLLFQWL